MLLAQWRLVRSEKLAYRCGGSAGLAARTAHRLPVSSPWRAPWGHLERAQL